MERAIEPSTSAGVTIKEPLSVAEAVSIVLCRGNRKASLLKTIYVIPTHTSTPMIQLQLKYDSKKTRRQELESLVDEYKKAKEHADAESIWSVENLNSIIKEQKKVKVCQASCNALLKQMLVELGS